MRTAKPTNRRFTFSTEENLPLHPPAHRTAAYTFQLTGLRGRSGSRVTTSFPFPFGLSPFPLPLRPGSQPPAANHKPQSPRSAESRTSARPPTKQSSAPHSILEKHPSPAPERLSAYQTHPPPVLSRPTRQTRPSSQAGGSSPATRMRSAFRPGTTQTAPKHISSPKFHPTKPSHSAKAPLPASLCPRASGSSATTPHHRSGLPDAECTKTVLFQPPPSICPASLF